MEAGRELDELVAISVMGDPKILGNDYNRMYEMLNGRWYKPYSTDIKAAWEVVQKFQACARLERQYKGGKPSWWCEISKKNLSYSYTAESAPFAICMAALMSVDDEDEMDDDDNN